MLRGVVWCGVVWCGMAWRGVVWCGESGMMWCGVVSVCEGCGVVLRCAVLRCVALYFVWEAEAIELWRRLLRDYLEQLFDGGLARCHHPLCGARSICHILEHLVRLF